jgi:transcriptional regulator with XRE-family HTH domain
MNKTNALRLMRLLSGKRQYDVGNEAGINQARISLIENQLVQPRQDEKERLAKALGMRPEEIWPE